jgi:hypothetical protein
MTKKGKVTRKEKKRFSSKQLMVISIIIASIIALGSVLSFLLSQKPEVFSLRAAIIDQLEEEFPNPSFVENVTNLLTTRGFNVTYYDKTLDVNFFRGLANNRYGIIILRVHSALREDNKTVDLFTSEEFKSYNHGPERENGLLVRGEFLYTNKSYFAITSKFIESLEGGFPKSIVIAMGCWSLKLGCEQMAMAYIDKGAKAYVGWTDIVLPKDTDSETFRLLQMLLNENRTLVDAVSRTNGYTYHGGNQTFYSHMRFYPSSEENLTISKLITEAKVSSSVTAFDSAKNFSNILIVNTIRKPKDFTWKN